MIKIALFVVLCVLGLASAHPLGNDVPQEPRPAPLIGGRTQQERDEAASAQYHFASNVQDGISDLTQMREEVRDGLNVKGYYSYSDGHYKRKVSYEADEKGYRVVGEEVEPLDGPQINPEGKASIHTMAHGSEVNYSVVGDDNTRHRRLHDKQQEGGALEERP